MPTQQEEEEWEYCNYGIEKEPRFGEMSYMVAGGGMMNGNAYATIELKDGLYYYCEYGNYPKRQSVGIKIVWSDEFYDKQNPYCSRNFNILDVEDTGFGTAYHDGSGFDDCDPSGKGYRKCKEEGWSKDKWCSECVYLAT